MSENLENQRLHRDSKTVAKDQLSHGQVPGLVWILVVAKQDDCGGDSYCVFLLMEYYSLRQVFCSFGVVYILIPSLLRRHCVSATLASSLQTNTKIAAHLQIRF